MNKSYETQSEQWFTRTIRVTLAANSSNLFPQRSF